MSVAVPAPQESAMLAAEEAKFQQMDGERLWSGSASKVKPTIDKLINYYTLSFLKILINRAPHLILCA